MRVMSGMKVEELKGGESADEREIIISHRRGLNQVDGFGAEEGP